MKPFILLPFLCSCQWIATHPAEDAAIITEAENVIEEVYHYETGHPVTTVQPPMLPEGK